MLIGPRERFAMSIDKSVRAGAAAARRQWKRKCERHGILYWTRTTTMVFFYWYYYLVCVCDRAFSRNNAIAFSFGAFALKRIRVRYSHSATSRNSPFAGGGEGENKPNVCKSNTLWRSCGRRDSLKFQGDSWTGSR